MPQRDLYTLNLILCQTKRMILISDSGRVGSEANGETTHSVNGKGRRVATKIDRITAKVFN